MKTKRLHRLLRTGEIYEGRAVLCLPMTHAEYVAHVEPLALDRLGTVKGVDYNARRRWAEVLVKLFPRDPGCDHRTARALRRALTTLRRRACAGLPGAVAADEVGDRAEVARRATGRPRAGDERVETGARVDGGGEGAAGATARAPTSRGRMCATTRPARARRGRSARPTRTSRRPPR